MRKLPFLLELYIVMFLVLVIPIIGITYYNTSRLLQYSENEIIKTTLENLSSIKKLNENTMDIIKTETISLAKNGAIEEIANLKKLDSAAKNIDSFMKLKNVEKILNQIVYGNDNIYSIYLYIAGADYVITSKGSILHIDSLRDIKWLDEYKNGTYNNIGSWVTRTVPYTLSLRLKNTGYSNVITYIYPLTSLTTSAKGVIVVNIYENKIANLINQSKFDENGFTFIIDNEGNIVSHTQKALFMKSLEDIVFIHNILESEEESGSIVDVNKNGRNLYVYVKDSERNWIYISYYSLNIMMRNVNNIRKSSIIWFMLITGFGLLLTFLITLWISKPLRKLVNTLRISENLSFDSVKNEIEFLAKAFNQMNIQKQRLYNILKKNKRDAEELFLNDLIKGNFSKYQQKQIDNTLLPHANFVVAILCIDNKDHFVEKYTPDQRYYCLLWIINQCRSRLEKFFVVKGIINTENSILLIANFNTYDTAKTPIIIEKALSEIQREIRKNFCISFSVGIGKCHAGYEGVHVSYIEALKALRYKILIGNGSIIFWNSNMERNVEYFYPYDREKRILNWLSTKNINRIEEEIHQLIQDIKNIGNISYDNIMHIFNQLIAMTIKYLVQSNINISEIFDNVYISSHKISGLDTLEDIENYVISFYRQIISYIAECESEKNISYMHLITTYIEQNYTAEISFEEMAENIGISYSYMRKIIKEATGKSLTDLINNKRVEEAKKLLLETNMNIKDIALKVGYNNDQSLTRFFKKYEGITPGEFRNMKG